MLIRKQRPTEKNNILYSYTNNKKKVNKCDRFTAAYGAQQNLATLGYA